MKPAITLCVKRGGKGVEILTNTDVPYHVQKTQFKEFLRVKEHEQFERVYEPIILNGSARNLALPSDSQPKKIKSKKNETIQ